jgi:mannose-6-phosphate isomerase-like protein (cupin superfamily)
MHRLNALHHLPVNSTGGKKRPMKENLPAIVTLSTEAAKKEIYKNYPIADVNDHVVRISIMTQPYHWHSHPNSDEAFLVIEGGLIIEFESGGEIQLAPGQMVTVARGVRHRTRPLGGRSVNLTFEAANSETQPKTI